MSATVLGACSGPRGVAPVVQRTGGELPGEAAVSAPVTGAPPAVPATGRPGAPTGASGSAAAPGGTAGADSGVMIQNAPNRGVEVRPLGPRPGEAAGAAGGSATTPGGAGTVSPSAAALAGANGSIKTGPRGLKRPYSDATLAEVQAADGSASGTAVAGAAPGTPAGGGTATAGGAAAGGSATGGAASGGAASGGAATAGGTAAGGAGTTLPANAAASAGAAAAASAAPATTPDTRVSASGFGWPANGKLLRPFSEPQNVGITIEGKSGDPIFAAADGKVIFSGPGPRAYGNLVIVKHDADTVSVYAHNKSLLVKEGDTVKRGQRVAELGTSGADQPQLQFEIRKQGKPVDPLKLLPKR